MTSIGGRVDLRSLSVRPVLTSAVVEVVALDERGRRGFAREQRTHEILVVRRFAPSSHGRKERRREKGPSCNASRPKLGVLEARSGCLEAR